MFTSETLANAKSLTEVECTLSASDSYVETITFKPLPAQPWLTELIIKTQLLTAKNPQEKRVKARCCIERAQLVSLASAINQFIETIGTPSEPQRHLVLTSPSRASSSELQAQANRPIC